MKQTGPPSKWGETLEDFNQQDFQLTKTMAKAGLVDVKYMSANAFSVKTANVRRFSLWLHPKMVEFAKPIAVITNGKARSYTVQPSLLDALRSYERCKDWSLIYYYELVIEVEEGSG